MCFCVLGYMKESKSDRTAAALLQWIRGYYYKTRHAIHYTRHAFGRQQKAGKAFACDDVGSVM